MVIYFSDGNAQRENQQTIAAISSTPAATKPQGMRPAAVGVTATQPTADQPKLSKLDQFMQVWLSATPAERDKIRQWVEE